MAFVQRWREIERELPARWTEARLSLTVEDPAQVARAAALLAPLAPGRGGRVLRFSCARSGGGAGPQAVRRTLERLDRERIYGELELLSAAEAAEAAPVSRPTLVADWEAALETLPDDWSHLVAEVELRASDHLERAALLMAPLNPRRTDGRSALRFRVARDFGYGASPGMTRRCLERCDRESIRARVRLLHSVTDADSVQTQGPVWYVSGQTV